jgi:hypothetical protein
MMSLTKRLLFAAALLYGAAGALPAAVTEMAGTWKFTLVNPAILNVVYSGQLTQAGNTLSEFAPFTTNGSSCSSTVAVTGTVSEAGAVTLSVNVAGTIRTMTGTVSADGNSAHGTYTSAAGGCITGTGSWTGTRAQQAMAQWAFGGGWYSALYFTNVGSTAASFTVTFTADDGTPLTVPSVAGSSTVVNLAPLGTAIIEAPNEGALVQGYVTFALPGGVVGYGVFRSSQAHLPDQEAVVPFADISSTATTLIWDDTNLVTAVAILNPSGVAATVQITVLDGAGGFVGTSQVSLAAHHKTAAVMRNLTGLSAMPGKRGSARFSVLTGNVVVLGLRANGSALTSIPTNGN